MDEQIIDFETGLLAKKEGFDIETEKCYAETKAHTFEDRRKHEEIQVEYRPPHISNTRLILDMMSDIGNSCHDTILCYAPTLSQLQTWMRDKRNIHVNPIPYIETSDNKLTGYYVGEIYNKNGEVLYEGDDNFPSYEEALAFGLKKVLTYD